jgi:hypothetical protein
LKNSYTGIPYPSSPLKSNKQIGKARRRHEILQKIEHKGKDVYKDEGNTYDRGKIRYWPNIMNQLQILAREPPENGI